MEGYATEEMLLARELITVLPILYRYLFLQRPEAGCRAPLPANQMQALIFLHLFPLSSMTQLASRLAVSKQQLTKIVDCLVKKELVQRMGSSQNRRLVLLELTDQGKQLINQILAKQAKKAILLFSGVTKEEQESLLQVLQLFRRILEEKSAGAHTQLSANLSELLEKQQADANFPAKG